MINGRKSRLKLEVESKSIEENFREKFDLAKKEIDSLVSEKVFINNQLHNIIGDDVVDSEKTN